MEGNMASQEKKKVLIIVYSDINRDARVLKQVSQFKDQDLTVLSFGNLQNLAIKHLSVSDKFPFLYKIIGAFFLKLGLFLQYYWLLPVNRTAYSLLEDQDFDLIIANDIHTLPLAVRIKKNAKLVYDAHEYYPLEHDNKIMWMFFFHKYMHFLTRRFAPQADLMLTVGESIAQEYEKNYSVKPKIVLNTPDYQEMPINPLNPQQIKIVHHGVALAQRNIELMIDIVHELGEPYQLDLYLVPFNQNYLDKLKAYTQNMKNITIQPPIEVNKIVSTLNHYDIGLFFLNSKSFNYINCLPNKLFDYIQARLAVLIGPSPEMKRIVEKYQCGYASSSFHKNAIIKEIKSLTHNDIYQMKINADKAAKDLIKNSNTAFDIIHLIV